MNSHGLLMRKLRKGDTVIVSGVSEESEEFDYGVIRRVCGDTATVAWAISEMTQEEPIDVLALAPKAFSSL